MPTSPQGEPMKRAVLELGSIAPLLACWALLGTSQAQGQQRADNTPAGRALASALKEARESDKKVFLHSTTPG